MSDVSLSPKAVAELRELQAKVGDNLLLAASDFTQKDPQFTDAEADWLAAINNAAPALLALASQSLEREGEIRRAAIAECAKRLEEFSGSQILLACGELSAQEMRTAKAVQRWWAAEIRALAQQPPAGEKK